MLLAKVVGTVVATRKDERLLSAKLLVARPMDPSGKPEGLYLVAVGWDLSPEATMDWKWYHGFQPLGDESRARMKSVECA